MREIERNAHVKVRIGNRRFEAAARVLDERNDAGPYRTCAICAGNINGAACRSRSRPTTTDQISE
jgi:hypothetical protein